MALNQRQTEMVKLLRKKKRMSVTALAQTFFVSEMTVRRDLKLLENQGLLQRYTGGAIINQPESSLSVGFRKLLHARQKAELAQRTRKFLHDGMNIFIDSSTTCMYILPLIAEYQNMHIITNSVQNLLFATRYHIPCTIVGGDYYPRDMCSVGSIAEAFLREINVDLSFFTSLGFADDGLITDSDLAQNAVRKIVMERCQTNVFLFENNKLHKKYLYTLCSASDATEIILL